MKKLILVFGVLIPSVSWACMPPFPSEIMIGRVDSLEKTISGIILIGFSSYYFPFRDFQYKKPTSWRYYLHDDYAMSHIFPDDIQKDSLIIALSDAPDGLLPQDYSIFHITTLNCKNNILSLGKKDGKIIGWNRKEGSCRYEAKSLLDVFLQGDERIWIKNTQKHYPTCDILEKSFPLVEYHFTGSTAPPALKKSSLRATNSGSSWFDWVYGRISTFFKELMN